MGKHCITFCCPRTRSRQELMYEFLCPSQKTNPVRKSLRSFGACNEGLYQITTRMLVLNCMYMFQEAQRGPGYINLNMPLAD